MLWIKTLHNTCTYYFVRKWKIVLILFLWCATGSLSIVPFKYRRRLSDYDFSRIPEVMYSIPHPFVIGKRSRRKKRIQCFIMYFISLFQYYWQPSFQFYFNSIATHNNVKMFPSITFMLQIAFSKSNNTLSTYVPFLCC